MKINSHPADMRPGQVGDTPNTLGNAIQLNEPHPGMARVHRLAIRRAYRALRNPEITGRSNELTRYEKGSPYMARRDLWDVLWIGAIGRDPEDKLWFIPYTENLRPDRPQ